MTNDLLVQGQVCRKTRTRIGPEFLKRITRRRLSKRDHGRRQRRGVELADQLEPHSLQRDNRGRHHVLGQFGGQRFPQGRDVDTRVAVQHHLRNQMRGHALRLRHARRSLTTNGALLTVKGGIINMNRGGDGRAAGRFIQARRHVHRRHDARLRIERHGASS
ncbi:hypothetical protein Bsp3421_000316 (plasmid) [Burkholderia sp. FERM BP-3421]|uniref:hypothetical protein n=1 Tax=Burkholderia sp. FERM BP-3421 TaxID=1494466 RepID=UPI00235DD571|nr:hypothetical protein [Burkholderia sp. FERM BP-3421]WDD90471.1 hypothetical protein Bsp3421_000316 [Burkholderia sp. FERM BP-3421]